MGWLGVVGLVVGGVVLLGKNKDEQTANAGTGESDGSGTTGTGESDGSGTAGTNGAGDGPGTAVAVVIDAGVPAAVVVDASVAPDTTVETPTTVEVSISSQPRGAKVYLKGSRKSLGKTPMVHTFDISKKPLRLVLKRRNYEDHEIKVDLTGGAVSRDLALKPKKPRGNGNGKTNSNGKGDGSGSGTGYKDSNETLKPKFGNK